MRRPVAYVSRANPGDSEYNKLVARMEAIIEFHYLLDRPDTLDDSVTLFTDDDESPEYRQSHNLSDSDNVEELEDGYLQVRFTRILPERSYGLEIDPGEGPDGQELEPFLLFSGAILPRSDRQSAAVREDVFDSLLAELPDEQAAPAQVEQLSDDEKVLLDGGMELALAEEEDDAAGESAEGAEQETSDSPDQ